VVVTDGLTVIEDPVPMYALVELSYQYIADAGKGTGAYAIGVTE
jgi:hypothetical protein